MGVTVSLWFDGNLDRAADFYADLFDSEVTDKVTYPEGSGEFTGTTMTASWSVLGTPFMGINGGPNYQFSAATSFQIPCADQAEIDSYWAALSEGGSDIACGWVTDRFGVTWQVVPTALPRLLSGPPEKAAAVSAAMRPMMKIDIDALQAVYDEA